MIYVILFYGSWLVGFVILLLLGLFIYDKRYKSSVTPQRTPSNGFLRTPEVYIDPKDGHTYRVYYNPRSGDREYIREEDRKPPD
jgi:hypothetical protein